jgi:hypothetical protein
MRKHGRGSGSPLEFRSLDAYLRHYFPMRQSKQQDDQDISEEAQELAATTVRAVRRQLAAR